MDEFKCHFFDDMELKLFRCGEIVTVSMSWKCHCFDEVKLSLFRWVEIVTVSMKLEKARKIAVSVTSTKSLNSEQPCTDDVQPVQGALVNLDDPIMNWLYMLEITFFVHVNFGWFGLIKFWSSSVGRLRDFFRSLSSPAEWDKMSNYTRVKL